LGFKKGRQYATTWLERAEDIGYWESYRTIGGIQYRPIDCCVEALKRDPEYAEAWCKLGLQITKMDAGEDTDKELAGMDLFKDEPKITDDLDKLHRTQINAAVFCFDKAIEIKPKYVDAWYEKGYWYTQWIPSRGEKQIECFLEVTKLDPKHKEAWHHLANAYASDLKYVWSSVSKAVKCYDEAIALAPDNLYAVYAKKADLLSKCVKQPTYFYRDTDSDLRKKYSSGKDALMCYDKALEIKPKFGYASYKKGILLERLSRYEEALECFERFDHECTYGYHPGASLNESVSNSNILHKQALRDKLKPNEDGSTKSFETYCRILGNFFKGDNLSEVEFARKKLNENILQHIHKLHDNVKEDTYEMGEWLQNIGREKEALELYDKEVEKSLEKGELYFACDYNNQKARYLDDIGRTKDAFDCRNKTIQLCEEFFKKTQKKDSGGDHTSCLADAYVSNAYTFETFGNMDKAIEYIDHAIKIEREYNLDDFANWWETKVSWLPDDEAIKFLDEEIKAWQNSSYWDDDEDGKKYYIERMESSKNKLLKKPAKKGS